MTRRARPGLVLLALGVSLAAAAGAWAQGTSGLLPSPISSPELDVYGELLGLTGQQRDAVTNFHEQYLEDFRRLRENEIEAYMVEVGGLWRRGLRGLDREAIEDSVNRLDRLMGRIALLDGRLFDQIQTVLTEEQVRALPRALQARERRRYAAGGPRLVGRVNRASRVDLGRLHAEAELDPQDREATEPLIVQYETRLTAAMKELHRASTRVFLDVAEALEEAGFPGGAENRRDMMQTMRDAWAEAMKKPGEKAAAISDLNRRTLKQLGDLLPPEAARALTRRYVRRAYPEIPRLSASSAWAALQAALGSAAAENRRDEVALAAEEFRAQRQRIVERMMDYLDEYRRTWSPANLGRSGRRDHEEKLDTFRARLAELDEQALGRLSALLGGLSPSIRAAAEAAGEHEADDEDGRGGFGAARAEAAEGAAAAGRDPFLPPPISRRDVAGYRQRLGLSDESRFILQSLHEEYRMRFNDILADEGAALREARTALATAQADGGAAVDPARIDDVYDRRERMLQSVLKLEARFFEDVAMLVASPDQGPVVERLRLSRLRDVYNRGLETDTRQLFFGRRGPRGGPGLGEAGREENVDLARVVAGLELDDASRTKVDELLSDYGKQAVEGFRAHYESVRRLRRAAEKLRAETASGGDDDGGRPRRSRFRAFRALMEQQGGAVAEAAAFMVELNRATLESLAEALPDAQREALREAYRRAAFPDVYEDPRSAGRFLAAVDRLTDLSEAQRQRVEAIREAFEPADRDVAGRMAALHAETEDIDEFGRFDRQRFQRLRQLRNRLEALRFERRELNTRTLRELRDVLTERQRARIGLTDEIISPEDGDDETL